MAEVQFAPQVQNRNEGSGLSLEVYPGTKGKRAGDLLLSMVMASLFGTLATLVVGFLTPLFGFQNRETFSRGVLVAAVTIFASWLLLGLCKVSEGQSLTTSQQRTTWRRRRTTASRMRRHAKRR